MGTLDAAANPPTVASTGPAAPADARVTRTRRRRRPSGEPPPLPKQLNASGRWWLLVMEFFDGAREIGESDADDAIIDQGLVAVRRMWEAGLAHRDIKPANLLVRDGRLFLIDSAFAQVRPSPWRQAVDLANMMLVLALRTNAARVYERARIHFTDSEIAEAFAATRGLTMPSQLRRMLRTQGRDLHHDFTALLAVRLPAVKIQRWTARRLVLTAAVLVGGALAASAAISLLIESPL